jgi:hypothetical protein
VKERSRNSLGCEIEMEEGLVARRSWKDGIVFVSLESKWNGNGRDS